MLGHLIWIYLNKNPYSKDDKRGKVFDISFKDIHYTSAFSPQITFFGYDSEHDVSGITFDNVTVNGKKKLNINDGSIQINNHVKNIIFK